MGSEETAKELAFSPVTARGKFRHEREITFYPRWGTEEIDGEPKAGHHVVTPFELESGYDK